MSGKQSDNGKREGALRTISEVSSLLGVPDHVLRFWETRFPQLKPLKHKGGRRYYRPADIQLLTRIRDLLYQQGYTIPGARAALRRGEGDVSPSPQGQQQGAAQADAGGEGAAAPAVADSTEAMNNDVHESAPDALPPLLRARLLRLRNDLRALQNRLDLLG